MLCVGFGGFEKPNANVVFAKQVYWALAGLLYWIGWGEFFFPFLWIPSRSHALQSCGFVASSLTKYLYLCRPSVRPIAIAIAIAVAYLHHPRSIGYSALLADTARLAIASGGEEEELEVERGFHRHFRVGPESYSSSP